MVVAMLNSAGILFQSSDLLWALSLMVIPIIVHLFNLRIAKKVMFSNVSLLKKVQEESTSKKKPIELIILLSRLLAIVFIVLAFAKPLYKDTISQQEMSNEVLIYLDNSMSMSTNNSEASNFDKAYSILKGVIENYPEGTDFRLLENSYDNSLSTKLSAANVLKELSTINQVGVDRTGREIVSRKGSFDFSNTDNYLVSDFNAIGDFDSFVSDSTSKYYLVTLNDINEPNFYIDSVYLANTFYSGEFSNNLVVELKATSNITREVNLRFLNDNQLLGTAQVYFENNNLVQYVYQLPIDVVNFSKFSIELDANDPDFDNTFYLTVNELKTVSILEIYNRDSNLFIESLFTENELFNFERSSVNSLDNTSFKNADVIVLNELPSFSNQLISLVKSFLKRQGTLIVIPNSNMPESRFESIGVTAIKDDDSQLEIDAVDFENPFFEGIFEVEQENIKMPMASTQWRLLNYEYALLNFKNGRPFLSKIDTDNIFFLSSSLSLENSNFANHALFVPIMYKLAFGGQSKASRLYYFTDEELISFPKSVDASNEVYGLVNASTEIIPSQRVNQNSVIIEVPKDQISVGQYSLLHNNDTIGTLSFNLPKSESKFDREISQKLRDAGRYDHIELLDINSEREASAFVNNTLKGKSLWRYSLLLALFFLFAEIILIRYL